MSSSTSYLPCGEESSIIDCLDRGLSLALVGERGAGLTALVEYALGKVKSQHLREESPHFLDARGLGTGAGVFKDLMGSYLHHLYGNETPSELRELSSELGESFSHWRFLILFERIWQERGPAVLVLDHFESLAFRIDSTGWSLLKNLIEKDVVQFVLLSRVSISDLENIIHSKFGQALTPFYLKPLDSGRGVRGFVKLYSGTLWLSDEVMDYLGLLAGGHRSLLKLLVDLLVRDGMSFGPTVADVDAVVGRNRERVRSELRFLFRGLEPAEDPLAEELRGELKCVFEIDGVPAMAFSEQRFVERLVHLGHLVAGEGESLRIHGSLLASLVRLERLRYWRQVDATDPSYAEWLVYDELLRTLLRGRFSSKELEARIAEALPGSHSLLEDVRRDLVWWGPAIGNVDVLSYLLADEMHELLVPLGAVDPSWFDSRREDLEWVSLYRRPRSRAAAQLRVSGWPQAKEALARLRQDVEKLHPRGSISGIARSEAAGRRILRWLHISDTHFRSEKEAVHGADKVVDAFLKTIEDEQLHRGPLDDRLFPPPDLVFFTGDLAHSGKAEEYLRAQRFLDDLLFRLDLGRDRLFLVPGNHDVNRKATRYLKRAPCEGREAFEAFRDARWRELYKERLKSYEEFCRDFFREFPERLATTERGFAAPQEVRVGEVDVVVYPLNSVWCGGLEDDQSKLVLGLEVLVQDLGRHQYQRSEYDIQVGLLHHPLHFLAAFEETEFKKVLGQRLDLLLLGHLHRGGSIKTITPCEEFLELHAGALFNDEDRANLAQVVEVDIESRNYTVYPLRYEKDKVSWERDANLGRRPHYVYKGKLKSRSGSP